jgi:hypothetical protein
MAAIQVEQLRSNVRGGSRATRRTSPPAWSTKRMIDKRPALIVRRVESQT